MASYTNSNNQKIEVTDEHLSTSVALYEELRKTSTINGINWKKHKKLMEQEGFNDSDCNEAYRCLIKRERKRLGILLSPEQLSTLTAETKLDTIKEQLGRIYSTKFEAREELSSLNRAKREIARDVLLVESITNRLDQIQWKDIVKVLPKKPTEKRVSKEMIACITDFHYGYEGKTPYSEYNPKIAEQLLDDYANELIRLIDKEDIQHVIVANLGDLVEGNLRNQSLFDTQKTLSQQAIDATELIIKFLTKLSQYTSVSYCGIAGNHDRLNPNAKENLRGDSVVILSNAIIQQFAKYTNQVKYIELEDEYYGILNVGDYRIMLVHGDRTPVFKDSVLADLSIIHGELDLILAGHYHRHSVREVAIDKYVAIFGSIKGIDNYSLEISRTSSRSQGVVIVDNYGFEIRQIKLSQ
ncbi:MAG: metallophosphoesterase [Streptobacillus sp.]